MKIGVVSGGFHKGNTADYVIPALYKLGHEPLLLDQVGFQTAVHDQSFGLFFCVDSGETLNLRCLEAAAGSASKTAYWFIDYRHNKHRPTRIPTDFENAQYLSAQGGWIFQAQLEDVIDCRSSGIERVSWLPMAADPDVWSDMPLHEKKFEIGFVGNIWDQGRLEAIQKLQASGLKAALVCNGQVWKEEAAAMLRSCRVGFNISSWYGTEFAFDLNMRFFEILSCGIPLITNCIPILKTLFPELPPNIRRYGCVAEILPTLSAAFADESFLASGSLGRQWIISNGTYVHRMQEALRICSKQQTA